MLLLCFCLVFSHKMQNCISILWRFFFPLPRRTLYVRVAARSGRCGEKFPAALLKLFQKFLHSAALRLFLPVAL